jgi:hypothetical protein
MAYPDDADLNERAIIEVRVERIVLGAGTILIHQSSDASEPIKVPWWPRVVGGRREILAMTQTDVDDRGIEAEARAVLLRSIAFGRQWLDRAPANASMDQIAAREGCTRQHVVNTLPLAFLAPDIVRAIIDARLPRGISARRIAQPELEWARQWEMLGIRP